MLDLYSEIAGAEIALHEIAYEAQHRPSADLNAEGVAAFVAQAGWAIPTRLVAAGGSAVLFSSGSRVGTTFQAPGTSRFTLDSGDALSSEWAVEGHSTAAFTTSVRFVSTLTAAGSSEIDFSALTDPEMRSQGVSTASFRSFWRQQTRLNSATTSAAALYTAEKRVTVMYAVSSSDVAFSAVRVQAAMFESLGSAVVNANAGAMLVSMPWAYDVAIRTIEDRGVIRPTEDRQVRWR